jgi:hypothetical protein
MKLNTHARTIIFTGVFVVLYLASWILLSTVGVGGLVTARYAAAHRPPVIHFTFSIKR